MEKAPPQFVLFMVWHESMRLSEAIEEREVGTRAKIDVVVKI